MASDALYSVWDPEVHQTIPERSRLYSLSPIGTGTPQVESLTGYIARLAEAHVLSVGDLVGRDAVCIARAGLHRRTALFQNKRPKGHSFHAAAYTINGTSASAQKWVRIFERLTCVRGLDSLTLLPLRHTLSDMLLFKRCRAWCPHCYEDDYTNGLVYERLSWTLQIVTVCSRHFVRLENHCPHCDKTLPPLAVYSRPGHCSACGEWLGRPADIPQNTPPSDEADFELYGATAAGDLLACSGDGGRLSAARFGKNLRMCIRNTTSGNAMAFAESTRISNTAVHSWLDGITLPRLDMLVRLSARLGISVSSLITSRGLIDIDWALLRVRFSQRDRGVKSYRTADEIRAFLFAALRNEDCPSMPELAKRLGFNRCERLRQVDPELCRRITRRYRAGRRTHWWKEPGTKRICELNRIRELLEGSLVQDPPVSVRSIAAMLGYADGNGGFIHRRFPELCRSIAIRRKAWEKGRLEALRSAVSMAILEQPPPTLHALSRRLGFQTSTTLRSWVPDLADRLKKKCSVYAAAETNKLRVALSVILQEDPAPSFASVARRLQRSPSSLKEKAPDLCSAIASRHQRQRAATAQERRKVLEDEVWRIAKDLKAKGQNPTQARILSLLPDESFKEWGPVQRAVKRARRFLSLS